MILTPKKEINARIKNFQKELAAKEFDGAVIILNSDLFYLTGTVQNAHLFVPAQGEPVMAIRKSLNRGREESPLPNIVPMKSPKELPGILASFGYNKLDKIGMELDVLPVNSYGNYRKMFPDADITDVTPLIKQVRSIKSPFEIDQLREAGRVIDSAYREVPRVLREGMTEVELSSLFEAALRRGGLAGSSKMRAFNQDYFIGNVCSGRSGVYPSYFDGPVGGSGMTPAYPQGAGTKLINRNEVVYIDYTCVINGYTIDQTRIFCMGKLDPKLENAFKAALQINEELVKFMQPGMPWEDAYYLAVKMAEDMGYKDIFMGYKDDKVRFVGHGIGLELDELPVFAPGLKNPLKPGMTFALEPKFVFPEGAVGIENSFVMTDKGPEYLSITPLDITYVD